MYYDQGWNAYLSGIRFDPLRSRDWRDGWIDAQCADMAGDNPQFME